MTCCTLHLRRWRPSQLPNCIINFAQRKDKLTCDMFPLLTVSSFRLLRLRYWLESVAHLVLPKHSCEGVSYSQESQRRWWGYHCVFSLSACHQLYHELLILKKCALGTYRFRSAQTINLQTSYQKRQTNEDIYEVVSILIQWNFGLICWLHFTCHFRTCRHLQEQDEREALERIEKSDGGSGATVEDQLEVNK